MVHIDALLITSLNLWNLFVLLKISLLFLLVEFNTIPCEKVVLLLVNDVLSCWCTTIGSIITSMMFTTLIVPGLVWINWWYSQIPSSSLLAFFYFCLSTRMVDIGQYSTVLPSCTWPQYVYYTLRCLKIASSNIFMFIFSTC